MALTVLTVLIIYLVLRTRINASPLSQIKMVLRKSQYNEYTRYIVNQMNLESGYLTNTLSQPPIYNPFSMSKVRIRPTTQLEGFYRNPRIDNNQKFGVYENYVSSAEDFILYLDYVRIPSGLDCQGYNSFIVSKGYASDKNYETKLNQMCG